MNLFYHIKLIRTIVIFTIIVGAFSCNSTSNELLLSKDNAMSYFKNLSPERGAYFYAQNREKYPFLDTFYTDSVFPFVSLCSYKELKKVKMSLDSTPLSIIMNEYFNDARNAYLNDIYKEIINYSDSQKSTFLNDIMPLIETEFYSKLTQDIENVIDKYSGGFLNYRKLEFFLGKDSKEFKSIWAENIDPQTYNIVANKYLKSYMDSISSFQEQYFYLITGRKISKKIEIQTPTVSVNISSNILNQVKSFTSNEKIAITTEVIKDYAAPVVLGFATGGLGAAIYSFGNNSYDIYNVYKDIVDQTVSPEEQLLSVCVDEVNRYIEKEIFEEIRTYVISNIESSNQVLFNLISLAL